GVTGDPSGEYRWVVDPIDGTVNFAYGIPHACVSIALQHQTSGERPLPSQVKRSQPRRTFEDGYATLLGVVYDPFAEEMWTALRGQAARLNGKRIRVSRRAKLKEAIISIGFAKTRENLEATLPCFNQLVRRIRKVRIMGAAALALTY